ncbi:hypothetical protein BDB00DRAFT_880123 [Zychaea mexicana]|uniref:uncharacterized protein n=1 Tax=Zychaea mexicana TaxID=64656 RepID=UPI0022FE7C49|nr:uncharacterized protein BDB00DRAFT_880123 [Zychaea mexicana]KAI9470437.1 hypothetical protein BDB00DRAFT_880123 [Zychaea mexicana]
MINNLRVNSDRKVSGKKPLEEQTSSIRPDFLVINDGLDFAVSECGKDDVGGISKKEIVERQLHVPKVMKDILHRALTKGNHAESLARTRVQAQVLDCPKGYICRLMSSNEYQLPQKADMISAQLFPLMKLTLQVKAITKSTIKAFKKHQRAQAKNAKQSVFTLNSPSALEIPPAFTIPTLKKSKTNNI